MLYTQNFDNLKLKVKFFGQFGRTNLKFELFQVVTLCERLISKDNNLIA